MDYVSPLKMEVCLFDPQLDFNELLHLLFLCDSHKIDVISVPSCFLKYKDTFTTHSTAACLIDFPFGLSTNRTRCASVIDAIYCGAKIIDIVVNPFYLQNFQRKELKKDVNEMSSICKERDVELRYIIDYKNQDPEAVVKNCMFLYECGVRCIITSSGVYVDDIYDNLILASEIKKFTPLDVIPASLTLEPDHLEIIDTDTITRIRIPSNKIKRFLGV
jgi:deoxyribose-phosphate aldolase